MSFEDYARRETASAFDALTNHVSAALRQELDALKVALDARMAGLEAALAQGDHNALVERLAEDLGKAAAEQTDQLVARARHETQEAAEVRFTEVQAGARADVEWARGENVALSASLDEARRQVKALEDASTSIAEARAEIEGQLAHERSANAEMTSLLGKAEADASIARENASKSGAEARAELEAQVAYERTMNAELSSLLEAQANALTAHYEAQRGVADLEVVQERIQVLENECRDLGRARDEAEARASSEAAARLEATSVGTERLHSLEGRLERVDGENQALLDRVKNALRAFNGAASAQAIFDTLVDQLAHEFVTVALFLHRRNRLEGWRSQGLDAQTDIGNVVVPLTMDSPLARAVNTGTSVAIEAGADGVKLGVFGKPVASGLAWPVLVSGNVVAVAYVEDSDGRLQRAGSPSREIAEILVEQVGRCLVMGRRAAATSAAAAPVLAVAPSSASAKAVEVAQPSKAGPGATAKAADTPAQGSAGQRATTKPPEKTPEPVNATRGASAKPSRPVETPAAAKVVPRQEVKAIEPSLPESGPGPGPAREVDRIKIRAGVEVTVDGTTGQLFDLSILGAQVTSSKSIRPQQLIRLVLPGVHGPLVCKGRIMWARFEKTKAGDPGSYRAGIKFTEADPKAVQAFLEEHREKDLTRPARTG